MKPSLSTFLPSTPKAREKKEQPAPTSSTSRGGDTKQCGTPRHPSASAATAASTPPDGMERAVSRGGGWDPRRRPPGGNPWPHRPLAACFLPRPVGGEQERATRRHWCTLAPQCSPPGEKGGRKGAGLQHSNAGVAKATGAAVAFVGLSFPGWKSTDVGSQVCPSGAAEAAAPQLLKEDSAQPNSSLIIPALSWVLT